MSQSLTNNLIHIVFSTKNREPFLCDQVRGEMFAFIKGACDTMDCMAIRVGGVADHVHIFSKLSKNMAGAKFVGEIKRVSSLWIKKQGPAYSNFAWQSGYGYFSISQKDHDAVVAYINNQYEHHKTVTFKNEFLAFCRKNMVPVDERYVWD